MRRRRYLDDVAFLETELIVGRGIEIVTTVRLHIVCVFQAQDQINIENKYLEERERDKGVECVSSFQSCSISHEAYFQYDFSHGYNVTVPIRLTCLDGAEVLHS